MKKKRKKNVECDPLFDQSESGVRDARQAGHGRAPSVRVPAGETKTFSDSTRFLSHANIEKEDATGSDGDLNGWVWKVRDADSSQSRSRHFSVAAKAL